MRNYILILLSIFLVLLFSCAKAYPPEDEQEYIPTIIYRVSSSTHTLCPLIRYSDGNGDLISLADTALPWEYQMTVDDDAQVTLEVQHLQDPVISGNATAGTGDFFLVDAAAPFDSIDESYTVLHGVTQVLHQISIKQSNSILKLNIDTFENTDPYEIYERMHYIVAIYRIDESGREDPLIYTDQLYPSINITLETYAYK